MKPTAEVDTNNAFSFPALADPQYRLVRAAPLPRIGFFYVATGISAAMAVKSSVADHNPMSGAKR